MDNTREDFNTRMKEVENYFKFLEIFDDDNTKLLYLKDGGQRVERIEHRFLIILLANAFLILYNLIEATVRNSIIELYLIIEEDNVSFGELNENLQKIWIKQETGSLKENIFRQDTFRGYVMNIAKIILNRETVKLTKENIDFSGNLDAKKIRNLAYQIGFEITPNGRNLVNIKNKRNRLAHGEQTFYDVGKDFSVSDLKNLKNETFEYLSDVIQKVEDFINNENYKI